MKELAKLIHSNLAIAIVFAVSGCSITSEKKLPTSEQAKEFIEISEQKVTNAWNDAQFAWYSNHRFLNVDTSYQFSKLINQARETVTGNAYQSEHFKDVELDEAMSLRLNRIQTGLRNPTPKEPENAARLTELSKTLAEQFAKASYCKDKIGEGCQSSSSINEIMQSSNDDKKLLELWQGWRDNLTTMQPLFQEKVTLNNMGAQRVGFDNMAEMRSARLYQMSATKFDNELDRVWQKISPLYESLQCLVRTKLGDKFGVDVVQQDKPIPAHLIGELTGSSWINLYDDVAPKDAVPDRGFNLTSKLISEKYDEVDLIHTADKFYGSMGLDTFGETFYQESMFVEPTTYKASCNSGFWWLYEIEQARIVQCLKVTDNDFYTAHEGLGLIHYEKGADQNQPAYARSAAATIENGTTSAMTLSITPSYIKELGFLDKIPKQSEDIGFLMKLALEDVSSIAFNILVDKWRLAVFSGAIAPKDYNQYWWQLVKQYQGISPNSKRDELAFDAGAVFAVINNQDLSLNAVTTILKYQMHKTLCEAAENTDILSHCSIYNSKKAGEKLEALFAMGKSETWSNTLATWTHEKQFDGAALVEYFAPLQNYLDEQNKGRSCGWQAVNL
jgi:peptidyl-dipeptidase A